MPDNSSALLDGLKFVKSLPEPLWSEDFAVLLGLKKSALGPGKDVPKGDEFLRRALLEAYFDRNLKEHQLQQDIIWSRFCALYLPAVVDRFLDPWDATDGSGLQKDPDAKEDYRLFNPWLRMLVMTQHNPYLGKYLRSKQPVAWGNLKLARTVGQRLLHLAPRWDRELRQPGNDERKQYYKGAAADVLQLLSTLLATFVSNQDPEQILPAETKQKLLPFVKRWATMFFDPSRNVTQEGADALIGYVCCRMVLQLSTSQDEDRAFYQNVLKVKKQLKGWDQCGLPTCGVTNKTMKACGKCHTAKYCCSDHQVLHWKWQAGAAHKQLCFETEF